MKNKLIQIQTYEGGYPIIAGSGDGKRAKSFSSSRWTLLSTA